MFKPVVAAISVSRRMDDGPAELLETVFAVMGRICATTGDAESSQILFFCKGSVTFRQMHGWIYISRGS